MKRKIVSINRELFLMDFDNRHLQQVIDKQGNVLEEEHFQEND